MTISIFVSAEAGCAENQDSQADSQQSNSAPHGDTVANMKTGTRWGGKKNPLCRIKILYNKQQTVIFEKKTLN